MAAYFQVEEWYYKLLDDLEEKTSVPVYDYFVEPVESKGIPSFLVALLLLLFVAAGSLLVLTAAQPPSVQVVVLGRLGSAAAIPLQGATVVLSDDSGVLSTKSTVKGKAVFDNVPLKALGVRAQKDGFTAQSGTVDPASKTLVRLELACDTPKTCIAAFLESGANVGDLNLNGSPAEPTPIPSDGGAGLSLGPGDGQSDLTFSNLDPDAPTGRLLIIVHDKDGKPLDGRATVYDAKTSGAIDFVDVVQGSGLVPNLAVGRQVYVDAFAEGYVPYFGNATVVPIRPATNKLSITLDAGAGDFIGGANETCLEVPRSCPDNQTDGMAGVRVVGQNGSAIAGARVSVFTLDRPEVLYSDYSDYQGFVALAVGNGSYFATASADGFLTNYSAPFKAKATVSIVLPAVNSSGTRCGSQNKDPSCGLGVNEARILAHATDDSGANASYADMVLKSRTDFGSWYVADQKSASGDGQALFSSLLVGTPVIVLASSYDQNGQSNATLVQGLNRIEIQLSKPPFQVKAFAFDPLARQYVANATFVSFAGTRTVGQCQGNGCLLTIVSGQDVLVNVSADGYVGSPQTFNLYAGIDRNVTLFLVNESALKDTFVQWQGLFDAQGHAVGQLLKPGRSYLAKVAVFARNADSTGVVMDTQNDDVAIAGLDPLGFDVKGSYAGSCYPSAVNFGNAYGHDAWVDARYSGAQSGTVSFNVTLDPQMQLDASSKTKVISFAYRSYVVRNGDYLRNPYDPTLLTKAGANNPSGCPAAAYVQNYTAKSTGTTCNGAACLTLRFAQGDQDGTDGFVAHNQILADNGSKLDPLYVYYTLELFQPPTPSAMLSFNAPSQNLVVLNATTPFVGASTLGSGISCDLKKGVVFSVWNASFSLNLSQLTQCTNFGLPFRMDGVAKGRVLQDGLANFSLTLTGVNSTLTHSGLVDVQGFGVAANDYAIVEAALGQPENQLGDDVPFSALSTGNCTANLIQEGKCDVGFINATYRITALSGGTLSAKIQNDGPLQLYDNQPGVTVPVLVQPSGLARAGQNIQGVARFLAPVTAGTSNISITRDLGAQSTTLSRRVSVGGFAISFNSSDPFPAGWDTCNGYVGISYNASHNPPLTLGNGCTDLAFRVSPIFPADATLLNVSIPDYGQVLTRASKTDGSDPCYEICETDKAGSVFSCDGLGKTLYGGQQYFLRYNPELKSTCPQKFKVNGNSIARSQITVEFGFTGDQTVRRNVTLHVLNDVSDPSIYLSPVYTMYSSAGRLYPQLWAVTNLKQLGPRNILFKQPSNFPVKFDGPGTQVVAINPNGGNIQAFDGSDLDHPILDLGIGSTSPVAPISRYSLALAALYHSIDLNIPGFQDYTSALAATLSLSQSENAFLDTGAANALSGSVPALANRTAYWRSSALTRYCQQSSECVSSLYTLPGCCRESLDAWKNNTVRMDFRQDSCTYCNNTYNPSCTDTTQQHQAQYLACTDDPSAHAFQCDQRCTLKSALPQTLQDAANQIGLAGTGVTVLNYGDTSGGRTCEVKFSSLNAFVASASSPFGSGSFSYYNPATPLASLTDVEVSRCQSNGPCPLLIESVSNAAGSFTGFGGTLASPDCIVDANGDGLYEPGEPISNSTASLVSATATPFVGAGASGGSSRASYRFACAAGQIIAVSESQFFTPGASNGVLVPRTVATAADIQRCRNGLCPMFLNPATDPAYPNNPMCVSGPTDNGFLNVNTVGGNSIAPAIPTGFGGYQCTSGFLAVAKYCFSSCENYCNKPNCDPSPLCLPTGASYVPTGTTQTIFNNWLNTTPVIPVRMDTVFLGHGKAFSPASLFSDAYQQSLDPFQSAANGKPVFSASYVVNSKNSPGALESMPRMLSVDGCGGSDYPYDQTLFPQQGLYQIEDSSTIDSNGAVWSSSAKAVDLPQKNYVGARADLCRKGNSWNTRLCETTFVDHSSQYGSCFNSILQYSGGPKRPGVELPLNGGLGDGIKQGTGYGVAPDGQVFALVEPGTAGDYCGNQMPNGVPARDEHHLYHVDLQTLHHWNALGQYTGQKDFNWVRDLGCNKDRCGCDPKKGGYGLLQILLPLAILALSLFVLGPALIGLGGTTVFAGTPIAATIGGLSAGAASTIATITGSILASAASQAFSNPITQSTVNLASNVITTIGVGDIGNCLSWNWGTAAAFACKGALWTITG